MAEIPQITDKRKPPLGIVPKNAQAWVLTGLAAVMVAVIALSGNNPSKARTPSPQVGSPVDPNSLRIQEYKARIEEQARKLQIEQARLTHTREDLTINTNGSVDTGIVTRPQTAHWSTPNYDNFPHPENSIHLERTKRDYESLFASNVALSYRKETPAVAQQSLSPTLTDNPTKIPPLYGYDPRIAPPMGLAEPASPTSTPQTAAVQQVGADQKTEPPTVGGSVKSAAKIRTQERGTESGHPEEKQYRLFEGTIIETVLTNRLNGSFSGPINCMVTTNVYSHDGQHLLIPQGSRVLGEVRRVETFGQERLAVFFHRLIMPDGYWLTFDQFHGLNQFGETGLKDQVNHHYLQIFGVSLAIGAIAGLSLANTHYGTDYSGLDAYRQGVSTSLSQSSLRILDRYLNVLPTFTIREGHRVKVWLSEDLLLPAYDKHQMPSDL
jgi:type IV secretion system protein VirB10